MAYNYYPYYQPYYQQPIQQPVQQMQQNVQQMPQQNQPQIQNSGFISVPNEEIVNTYPVAPGNCVTFKIEGKPIVMEKSMGFSQLESPKIERYRLVKEEPVLTHTEEKKEEPINIPQNDFKAEFDEIWAEIEALKKEISKPVEKPKKKKEVVEDESDA